MHLLRIRVRKTFRFEKNRCGKFFILLGAAEYVVFLREIKGKKVKISGPKGPYTTWFENGTVHMGHQIPKP